MLTELACYNQDTTYEDILQSVFWATQKSVELVALPSGFMPRVSDFLEHQKFSAAIDFPYGLSNTEVRVHEIILAARQGASFVDLVINSGFIKEKNWSRFRKTAVATKKKLWRLKRKKLERICCILDQKQRLSS